MTAEFSPITQKEVGRGESLYLDSVNYKTMALFLKVLTESVPRFQNRAKT